MSCHSVSVRGPQQAQHQINVSNAGAIIPITLDSVTDVNLHVNMQVCVPPAVAAPAPVAEVMASPTSALSQAAAAGPQLTGCCCCAAAAGWLLTWSAAACAFSRHCSMRAGGPVPGVAAGCCASGCSVIWCSCGLHAAATQTAKDTLERSPHFRNSQCKTKCTVFWSSLCSI